MNWFRFNPDDYEVGSKLYIADGYSERTVIAYEVIRKTATKQIVAKSPRGLQVRVNARGRIVGQERWDRKAVVSAEQANEIAAKQTAREHWLAIRTAAEALETAARRRDDSALSEALDQLTRAVEAKG